MDKSILVIAIGAILVASATATAVPTGALPQPVFKQENFLLSPDIPEMNVDFAIAWTDSVASFFVYPFDAVVLHVEIGGQMRDVFVFSDLACSRLMTWVCTEPDGQGERDILAIGEFQGEPGDELKSPSGLATNAINRQFSPAQDVIYVADRGNDRILELRYQPDSLGGTFVYNRILGAGYLEWPVDVAISAYGDQNLSNADLYVVDWGHAKDEGEMVRINILTGAIEGSWHNIYYPESEIIIGETKKPISVACFPFSADSVNAKTAIYVTEERVGTIFLFESTSSGDPVWVNLNTLDPADYKRRPGGIGFDDYGRVYIANNAAGQIEMYGPNMNYVYAAYDHSYQLLNPLVHPTNIVFDTFHDICEALVLEMYFRDSGLRTFEIKGGWSSTKPPLGFDGNGLPKIPDGEPGALPLQCALYDAYPNPFNSTCMISFALPRPSDVKIDIFNILGQKVTTLLNEPKEAGEHSVVFDADDLGSGVYFYRLQVSGFREVKSVILLK